MGYHKFKSEQGEDYGSFEVFYVAVQITASDHTGTLTTGPGWYWWSCFPGSLPDDDPNGPFASEEDAITDARGRS